jgi:predicted alpha/beta-fold hydrolase
LRPDFEPLVRNPHLLTIAGNFWPRKIDARRFPALRKEYRVDAKNTIVAFEHQPAAAARAQIILLHGLEGSADAGYLASFSQSALERGFGVHRLNMRTCGGTENACETMYHSGLTSDPQFVAREIAARCGCPLFLVGFSLGGNVALKLAGELGESRLFQGVIAVSTPIDLARCVREIDRPANFLYARRFLDRLRSRVRRKSRISPELYSPNGLDQVKSIWEFDDRFTAPLFGFGTAANYYATQSAQNFLDAIRIPTLVITAQDDPLVPFEIYQREVFRTNPALTLIASEHGGHLGFLSRKRPRFWLDEFALNWIETTLAGDASLEKRRVS